MEELPRLYFRVRESGAAVFRVESETRDRRLEMRQIAVVNVRSGEVRVQGGGALDPADEAEIAEWLAARRATLQARALEEARGCAERLGRTAQWAQSSATPDELEAVTDELLLAMHDLRGVLLRRKAERIAARQAPGGE